MTFSDAERIGKLVRKLRKEVLKQTQEQFAEGIDRSTKTVSNIEHGLVIPTMDTMLRISRCTGKPLSYFLEEEEV